MERLPDYEELPFLPVRLFKEFELRSCAKEKVVKNRNMFSARGASILGFSMFGSKRQYALDEEMELDIEGMKAFLQAHEGETIFMFGFTFMVWQHFYKKLLETGYRPDLSRGVLIHGGGWKKLVNERVSPEEYKARLQEVCGILPENVHDYYGMVEQTGCGEGVEQVVPAGGLDCAAHGGAAAGVSGGGWAHRLGAL